VKDSTVDGRQYPVSGGGQLRPVVGPYGADQDGAFATR
jgi:hypothetical protein